ncbi:MAG: 4Fe-4S binding protein [Erysipelotrichaceae bacterium]|nr:4Fe-4S binding protein [Erysipelotrichaceae bacterium]MDD4642263.1 4Fe-4S binding protein [Erysipelotrichaceae bacterium]
MKRLLILSGKGGTGKTTVAGAFIKLAQAEAVADCDVDAPNLHLIITNKEENCETSIYHGLPKAMIDHKKCINCGLCFKHCRFDAIIKTDKYKIDTIACEGCGVCQAVCPTNAITMIPIIAGEKKLYVEDDHLFSTACLKMGNGTSGMLVSEVKKQLDKAADDVELAIIDGSPGIGCPVIASISGVDLVLIVTEPSISGISDMERIVLTALKLQAKVAICINKYDTNLDKTNEIKDYCKKQDLPFVGMIPFDQEAINAINAGLTIVEVESLSGLAVRKIYDEIIKLLFV